MSKFPEPEPGPPMQNPYPEQQQPPIQQQPSSVTAHSTTVVMQQQQAMIAIQHVGPRPWSTGLCGCCSDCGSCCLVMCFPLCFEMHLWDRMGESCCGPCCVPTSAAYLRVKLRTQENIEGSIMNDYCTTCCCYQLVLCQLSREFDSVKGKTTTVSTVGPAPIVVQ